MARLILRVRAVWTAGSASSSASLTSEASSMSRSSYRSPVLGEMKKKGE